MAYRTQSSLTLPSIALYEKDVKTLRKAIDYYSTSVVLTDNEHDVLYELDEILADIEENPITGPSSMGAKKDEVLNLYKGKA